MNLIKATRLEKWYGGKEIVQGISINVGSGEIVAVIGPNGAGKTTTMEMLVGLRKADSGEIEYGIGNFKAQTGMQLQSVPFFPGLTAKENLELFAAFYKRRLSADKAEFILAKCGLAEKGGTEASRLSGGQQKRLAIAITLVHDPMLVFLDEPTAALDPRSRREVHNLLHTLNNEGKTIVFTSHDMDEVQKLATRIIMIDKGKVLAEGTAQELCEKYGTGKLENVYLDLTFEEA